RRWRTRSPAPSRGSGRTGTLLRTSEMSAVAAALQWVLLLPVVAGSVYAVLCVWAISRLRARSPRSRPLFRPPVTLLKPICGLEKDLAVNVRRACRQDYPEYQVVLSVQTRDDPALPLLREIQAEFGPDRVDVVVDGTQTAPNGKIRNLLGALPQARHDTLV